MVEIVLEKLETHFSSFCIGGESARHFLRVILYFLVDISNHRFTFIIKIFHVLLEFLFHFEFVTEHPVSKLC